MSQSKTEVIQNQLLESGNIFNALAANEDSFTQESLGEYLNQKIQEKQMKKSDVPQYSGLSTSYVYEIFASQKIPTREKAIQLAFGLKLSFSETQRLLKLCLVSELYSRNKRDAVLIFALNKQLSIFQTDELLFEIKEKTLLQE